MPRITRIIATTLALAFGTVFLAPKPVYADGAASTRNIIFGAAAVGGTLLIINHNKKVHQKYAEYDQRQAQLSAENANMQAAYNSQRSAYNHEVALVNEYKKEVAYQHQVVTSQQAQIAQLRRQTGVSHSMGFVQPTQATAVAHGGHALPELISYGWGTF
jgi:cell division protein FtsB